jgi:NAD(P)-dependent dehydrogenase (short-subunit alcohol dehydrogenase family)
VVKGKTVLVAGASGGLGSAFARQLAMNGAKVICAGRKGSQADEIAAKLGSGHLRVKLDLLDPASLAQASEAVRDIACGKLDYVVNSVGGDVRKSFSNHTELNFLAAANLLKLCLPLMRSDPDFSLHAPSVGHQFIQITGFVNGRIGFPFYGADAAMRAATRTLFASVQRELTLKGRADVRLRLFSPAVADTEAERPYLGIWRSMGIEPVSPDEVAVALLKFMQGLRSVGTMGGRSTQLSALIDDLSPGLTDSMWLSQAGKALAQAFDAPASLRASPSSLGIVE